MIEPIPTWRCGRCGCKVQAKLPPLGELHRKEVGGPWWEMTFWPPRDSPQWADRDTTARYAARVLRY